jgi:TolA-binding protein
MKHTVVLGTLVSALLVAGTSFAQSRPVERFTSPRLSGSALRDEVRSEVVRENQRAVAADRTMRTSEAKGTIEASLRGKDIDLQKQSKMEIARPGNETRDSACRGGDDACGISQLDPGGESTKGMNAQAKDLVSSSLRFNKQATGIKAMVR